MGTATLSAVIDRAGSYTLHCGVDGARDIRFTAFGVVDKTDSKFSGKQLVLQVVRAKADGAEQAAAAEATLGAIVVSANLEPQTVPGEDITRAVPPIEVYLLVPICEFDRVRDVVFSSANAGSAARLSVEVESPDFADRTFPSIEELDTSVRRDYRLASFDMIYSGLPNRVVRTPAKSRKRENSAGLGFAVRALSTRTSIWHSAIYTWKIEASGLVSCPKLGLKLAESELVITEFETDRFDNYPTSSYPGYVCLRKDKTGFYCTTELYATREALNRMATLLAATAKGDNVEFDVAFAFDSLPSEVGDDTNCDVTSFSMTIGRALR